ncbi:MAG: TonB-dependent receptor, partial [Chitinophagaceae bacterium]|nr:TonB-dependent receptor [Chitinophagaceae bacterium]
TQNIPKGDILSTRQVRTTGYNFRNQLNLNRRFGKHQVDAVAGAEIINTILKGTTNPIVYGYNDDKLTVGNFPNGITVKNWMNSNYSFNYTSVFSQRTSRFFSLYGNAAYTFDSKYTLSASVRSDASNLITDDPALRYSPFWSVGMRWQLHREKFLHQADWLDQLSFRLTYGYNGNIDKSTSFKPLISLGTIPDLYTNNNVATISSYGNPTLRWEKTGTVNAGIDYMLLGGKLFGKIDYYRKDGKDLLAQISIPSINGTTSQKFNNAVMVNHGIELELGTTHNFGKIKWMGSLNFSYNKNKILDLYRISNSPSDLSSGGTSGYVENRNSQTLWAYKYAGMYNLGTQATPNWQPMIQGAGKDTRYAFSDGWPKGNATDYMVDMGTRIAPYTVGFFNQFAYRELELSFMITGKFGHVFRRHSFNYPDIKNKALPNARYEEVLNGDPMTMLTLPRNNIEANYGSWFLFYPYLDYLTEKADHIRLQELNLSYNLPARFLSRSGINTLRVYAQGNNLFVLTNNKYHEDPETPLGNYRLQAAYTLGFKLIF